MVLRVVSRLDPHENSTENFNVQWDFGFGGCILYTSEKLKMHITKSMLAGLCPRADRGIL